MHMKRKKGKKERQNDAMPKSWCMVSITKWCREAETVELSAEWAAHDDGLIWTGAAEPMAISTIEV